MRYHFGNNFIVYDNIWQNFFKLKKYGVEFDFFGQTWAKYHAQEVLEWFKILHDKGFIDKKAEKKKWEGKIIDIKDNVVTVKLHEGGGYSYSYFNDVDLDAIYFYPDTDEFKFKVLGYN